MTKIKIALVIMLSILLVALSFGGVCLAFADTENNGQTTEQETVDPNISLNKSDLEGLADSFTDYLKNKYGADYEFYYNQIIEQWGSVEGYLLSFGNKLPEKYQSGWDKFVSWLGEYAPVWAPALAILIVILVAIIGKKAFDKLVERVVNAKLSPIAQELNKQSSAMITILHGQKVLLGNSERFAETAKELENSEKELTNG